MAQDDKAPESDAVRLTPEQVEMVRQGLNSLETGERFTSEQVREYARKKVQEWLPDSRTA